MTQTNDSKVKKWWIAGTNEDDLDGKSLNLKNGNSTVESIWFNTTAWIESESKDGVDKLYKGNNTE